MSYKLEPAESIAAGIVRMESEQIEAAIKHLSAKGDIDTNIHSARKCLKRLRALVQLTKAHGDLKKEQRYFREAGHELRQWRESAVLRNTAQSFRAASSADPHMEALWSRVLLAIDTEMPSGAKNRDDIKASTRHAIRLLRKARKVDHPVAEQMQSSHLLAGLKRTYGRARGLLKKLQAKDDVEVSHQLRRQVKYLWYDMQVLEDVSPQNLQAFRADLGVLGELLGDEHDLVDLRLHLTALETASLSLQDLIDLSNAISERREALHEKGLELAARLLAEKPQAFTERIEQYLLDWKRTAEAA